MKITIFDFAKSSFLFFGNVRFSVNKIFKSYPHISHTTAEGSRIFYMYKISKWVPTQILYIGIGCVMASSLCGYPHRACKGIAFPFEPLLTAWQATRCECRRAAKFLTAKIKNRRCILCEKEIFVCAFV